MKKRKNGKNKLKRLCPVIVACMIIVAAGLLIYQIFVNKNNIYVLYSMAQGMEMNVEDYIPGAVMSIVPSECETETIKAVAVMVRTYIMQEFVSADEDRINIDELGIDYISPESLKNALGGEIYSQTMKKYEDAVEDTKGQVMKYNGELIVPLYHMVSAGNTRNAKDVFGRDVAYMISKECDSDVESADYLKVVEIEREEFDEEIKSIVGKECESVTVGKCDKAGYVLEINAGDYVIDGEEFASIFDLNSSCFTIEESDESVRIVTKGQGHGLGMSIFGANQLAKEGKNYIEILKYFYNGVEIE